jgi:hypothetical protein
MAEWLEGKDERERGMTEGLKGKDEEERGNGFGLGLGRD